MTNTETKLADALQERGRALVSEFPDSQVARNATESMALAIIALASRTAPRAQPASNPDPHVIAKKVWTTLDSQSCPGHWQTVAYEAVVNALGKAQPASVPDWRARSTEIEAKLRDRGVVDVKFDFAKTDESISQVANDCADFLEAVLDMRTKEFAGLGDYPAQPVSDDEWLTHPQTVKAREQWCAVAKALGADPDDPDAVLKAAQPASVADLQLTQLDRESLNYLGSALKHKPHAEAVDKALVICDHYARRAQLTICHEKLHERMLAAAPQPPAKESE